MWIQIKIENKQEEEEEGKHEKKSLYIYITYRTIVFETNITNQEQARAEEGGEGEDDENEIKNQFLMSLNAPHTTSTTLQRSCCWSKRLHVVVVADDDFIS